MVFFRLLLTGGVAAPFLCDNMQQHGFFDLFRLCKQLAHAFQVVPVHRAEINKAHLLKQRGRQHEALDARLGARDRARHRRAAGDARKALLDAHLGTQIARIDAQTRQMAAESADILRNGHIVVIEHNKQRLARGACVAQRLVCHAAGQRAVADDRDHMVFLVPERARMRHAQRDRDRVRRMAGHAGVGHAFLRLHKPGKAAVLPQCIKAVTAAGQYFMHIALVAHIIDDAVARGVELPLKRHRQLHYAEVGGQMPPCARYGIHNELPQRRTKHVQRII